MIDQKKELHYMLIVCIIYVFFDTIIHTINMKGFYDDQKDYPGKHASSL